MYLNLKLFLLLLINFVSFNTAFAKNKGDLDGYTKEELNKISILRERAKDILTNSYMFENKYLIRFLRTNKLDIDATVTHLKETYKWRKLHNADKLQTKDWSRWMKRTPFNFYTDKQGRPSVASGLKDLDLRRLVLAGQADDFRKYIIFGIDYATIRLHRISNETGREITNYNAVFNLAGYDQRKHACLPCIPLWIELAASYENYYPLMGYKLSCINTPRIFLSLYKIVKPFLKEETTRIINLYGLDREEYSRELLKDFDEDVLPKEFGGKAEPKAWNDIF